MSRCTCDNAPGGCSCEDGQMAVCVSRFGNCDASCVTLTDSVKQTIQKGGNYPELIEEILNRHFGINHTVESVDELQIEINLVYKRNDGAIVHVNVSKDDSAMSSDNDDDNFQAIIEQLKVIQGEGES